jgi:hypothetical protein
MSLSQQQSAVLNAIEQVKYAGRQKLEDIGFREHELYGDVARKVLVMARELPRIPGWPPIIHIMIVKLGAGRMGVDRFSIFQEVKNQVMGENCEAVEIYPAEERLRNMAHAYHLFGFADPDFRLPFGMMTRGVKGE